MAGHRSAVGGPEIRHQPLRPTAQRPCHCGRGSRGHPARNRILQSCRCCCGSRSACGRGTGLDRASAQCVSRTPWALARAEVDQVDADHRAAHVEIDPAGGAVDYLAAGGAAAGADLHGAIRTGLRPPVAGRRKRGQADRDTGQDDTGPRAGGHRWSGPPVRRAATPRAPPARPRSLRPRGRAAPARRRRTAATWKPGAVVTGEHATKSHEGQGSESATRADRGPRR